MAYAILDRGKSRFSPYKEFCRYASSIYEWVCIWSDLLQAWLGRTYYLCLSGAFSRHFFSCFQFSQVLYQGCQACIPIFVKWNVL